METHDDFDAKRSAFMKHLQARAEQMKEKGMSQIASGAKEERPLSEWKSGRFGVRHMPDDSQGILRISIGGGNTPLPVDYITFRGEKNECIHLLRQALAVLEGYADD